ncbi:MAG: sensor histidine kinase [Candidatus Binatia bacterium]
MKTPHELDLDLNIARARIILSLATVVSVYVDPNVPDMTPWIRLTGGPMRIDRLALGALCVHLLYSTVVHAVTSTRSPGRRLALATTVLDVLFGTLIALFTEGPTSPSFAFFAFAIVAVGCREGFGATIAVTLSSMALYLSLILVSAEGSSVYLMRPVYLGITGYLIGFLGQQRINFEQRVRELESRAERSDIARSLHDGYVQALAAVNLRLATCRKLLAAGHGDRVLAEIDDLRSGVAREYDGVRAYVRSLVEIEARPSSMPDASDTWFRIDCRFGARGLLAEQILRILIEGTRNTMQHASARSATFSARDEAGVIRISLGDDGVGFSENSAAPWSIASRISDLGGRIELDGGSHAGAHLEIELPVR